MRKWLSFDGNVLETFIPDIADGISNEPSSGNIGYILQMHAPDLALTNFVAQAR